MTLGLIIVESPTKIKTIKKYLGNNYEIMASLGHVKDLPKNNLGIDVKNDFNPTYEIIADKKKIIAALKKSAKKAASIYLAPDPDREGEAIAWHIAEEIQSKDKHIYRVLFNDLSKNTVISAVNHPLKLDFNKYEAQQTRRVLDRLVGYQISPLLWEKVKRGLSAGRVQSVAVRLICDREAEIAGFVPEEYWNITASLAAKTPPEFEAKLLKIGGKKAKVVNALQAKELVDSLQEEKFTVVQVDKKEVKKSSPPPFTTSKLQQEAARWLRFSPSKTMRVAQSLYEGVEIASEGSVGLITYMRTDSVRISEEAINWARVFIGENYGADFLPEKAKYFKNQSSAQDAHEAIRPTSSAYQPRSVKSYLTPDQFRLYQLIWNRFIASQINPALYDQTTIDIGAGNCLFRSQGTLMKFAGFTVIYSEGKDQEDNGELITLPQVAVNELLKLIKLTSEQRFTQPPPRFTEASLVRELEERGIGRPSTYAAILSTIQARKYVLIDQGKFFPSELGTIVNDLLVHNFPHIMDIDFTASMEKKLDLIEEGKTKKIETLKEFYDSFAVDLIKAKSGMKNIKREEVPTEEVCEKCQNQMVIKWGRNGRFLACPNYPQCKNTKNLVEKENALTQEPKMTDMLCDKCGKHLVVKKGRYGDFLGCSGYPDCKNILPISLGVDCPEPGCMGYLCEKKSKKGKIFFSCSRYPACTFALWDKPVQKVCPTCQAPFLIEKRRRDGNIYLACRTKECGYTTKE